LFPARYVRLKFKDKRPLTAAGSAPQMLGFFIWIQFSVAVPDKHLGTE